MSDLTIEQMILHYEDRLSKVTLGSTSWAIYTTLLDDLRALASTNTNWRLRVRANDLVTSARGYRWPLRDHDHDLIAGAITEAEWWGACRTEERDYEPTNDKEPI